MKKIIGSLVTSLFIFGFVFTPLAQAQTVTIAQLEAELATLQQQLANLLASQSTTATQTTTVVPVTTSSSASASSLVSVPSGYTEVYTEHNYNKTWHIFFSPNARTWFTEKTDDKTGGVDWTHPVVSTVTNLGNSTNCGQVDSESGRNGCIGGAVASSISALLNTYPLAHTNAAQGAVLKFPSSYITSNSYEIDYVPSSGTWTDTKSNGNGLNTWVHSNITATGLVTECGLIQRDANSNTLLALSSVDQVAANSCAFTSVLNAYNVANVSSSATLSSVAPTSIAPGGQVTLAGSILKQTSQIVFDGSTVLPGLQFGSVNGDGVVPTIVVAIPSTATAGTHTLQAKLNGGLSNAETVTVTSPVSTESVSLTADKTSVTAGTSVTLSWQSVPNSSTSLSCWTGQGYPDWNGTVSSAGSRIVSPSTDVPSSSSFTSIKYEINCTDSVTGKGVYSSVIININPTQVPTSTLVVSANPTTITPGQSSIVTVSSSAVTSCSTNIPGSQYSSTINNVYSVSPTQTTTYSVTCVNATGQSVTGSATVTVTQPNPVPTVSVTANPTSIAPGQSVTITTTSQNATSCSGSANGLTTVNPTQTTTYTYTCTNSAGSATASATVFVQGLMPVDTYTPPTSNVYSGLQALLQQLSQSLSK